MRSIDACPYFCHIFSLPFYHFLYFHFLVFYCYIIVGFSLHPLTFFFLLPLHLWLPLPFIVNWFDEISPFLPLRLHQLLLVSYGHSFRTPHKPIGCSTTTFAQSVPAAPLPILGQNPPLFCLSTHLSYLTQMDNSSSPSLYLPL